MTYAAPRSPHSFHIPVMGTGFMIDAPLRVAKYGISSVISLVDDVLIEQMRRFHCQREGEPYVEIAAGDDDARAHRITAYLNLLGRLVRRQVAALQASPFEPGSEITHYFEMLPDGPLAADYRAMLAVGDSQERLRRQERLRVRAVPGQIDVNIMSKGDRDLYRDGEKLPPRFSDASAALRGYAQSELSSAIVFSAGMNPRLYGYAAEFADFFPDDRGRLKKEIVLKVSDFHSAAVQGKFLAKRGLWVSEYRIESGLNCGGHAFATRGLLMGPILEEFRDRRGELVEQLHAVYAKAMIARDRAVGATPLAVRITAQGGIGTADEDLLLRECYGVDGTGWGTPFLLVPEVTNVDDDHLARLCAAGVDDVHLGDNSPFGLPFWNLRTSASEDARRHRIAENRPGSSCTKGFAKLFNTEFTKAPICTASREYQKLKLQQLAGMDLSDERRAALREGVLAKSCICHDLAGSATRKNGMDLAATPAVCCGPNIVNFSRVATLREMVEHIYGRISLLNGADRPHMFLRELAIYISYLRNELTKQKVGIVSHPATYFREFVENLLAGVDHYRRLANRLAEAGKGGFLDQLEALQREVRSLLPGEVA
ncbi:MAG: hypothetical protein ACYC35_10980 [Pirellulales bacterium]